MGDGVQANSTQITEIREIGARVLFAFAQRERKSSHTWESLDDTLRSAWRQMWDKEAAEALAHLASSASPLTPGRLGRLVS